MLMTRNSLLCLLLSVFPLLCSCSVEDGDDMPSWDAENFYDSSGAYSFRGQWSVFSSVESEAGNNGGAYPYAALREATEGFCNPATFSLSLQMPVSILLAMAQLPVADPIQASPLICQYQLKGSTSNTQLYQLDAKGYQFNQGNHQIDMTFKSAEMTLDNYKQVSSIYLVVESLSVDGQLKTGGGELLMLETDFKLDLNHGD